MLRDTHADVFTRASQMDWLPMFDGISFKPLRVSEETGTWTVIFHCEKGSSFAPHIHVTPGEYYMVRGKMEFRAGTAVTGDYGFEPVGAYHQHTHFIEETDIYFTNFGPIGFVDEDKQITFLMDYVFIREEAAKRGVTI